MKKLRINKGFSLVTVMVGFALAAGLGVVIMRLTQQGNQVIKRINTGANAIDYQFILEDIFKNTEACTFTFGPNGISGNVRETSGYAPSANENLINDGTGLYNGDKQQLWTIDSDVIGKFKLIEVRIPDQVADGKAGTKFNFIPYGENKGAMQIFVKLKKPGKRNLGGNDQILKFSLSTIVANFDPTTNTTDAKGNIVVNPKASGNDFHIKKCQLVGSGTSNSEKGFTEFISYKTPGNYNFTIPDNVSRIWVKSWGAGGGGCGAAGGSGAGGSYCEFIADVVPKQILSIVVGAGGNGAIYPTVAESGGKSGVNGHCLATGGPGGDAGGGRYFGSIIAGEVTNSAVVSSILMVGGQGDDISDGKHPALGGDSPNGGAGGQFYGHGESVSFDDGVGQAPGGGGAAKMHIKSDSAGTYLNEAGKGGDGLVIIWY